MTLIPKKITRTIKELPTKLTQVNSLLRLPFVRNQHVNNETQIHNNKHEQDNDIKNHKVSNNVQEKYISVERSVPYQHKLSNGKTANILFFCRNGLDNDKWYSMNSDEVSKYMETKTSGYLKLNGKFEQAPSGADILDHKLKLYDELGKLQVSEKAFKELGIDSFLESMNSDNDQTYSLLFEVSSPDNGRDVDFGIEVRSEKLIESKDKSASLSSSPEEGMFSMSMFGEKDDAFYILHNYTRIESPDRVKGAGIRMRPLVVSTARDLAKKHGFSEVESALEAGLTTGTYLWNSMGYHVRPESIKEYTKGLNKGMGTLNANSNLYSTEEFNKVYNAHKEFMDAKDKLFEQTGDTEHLKDKFKLLYDYLPGVSTAYDSYTEWYKKAVSGSGTYSCNLRFNVDDSPANNKQLKQMDEKHFKVTGKHMKW